MPLYLDSFHPVHMHIIKTLHSLFVIGLLTTIFPSQATAANNATNNQTKIDLVKKVYLSKVDLGSEHNRVTTPELQKIIRQFNKFDTNIRKQPDMEMGCDMPIHYLVKIILITSIKPCKSKSLLPIPSGQHLNNLTAIGSVQISR